MSVQINQETHLAMRREANCPTRTDIDAARTGVFGGGHKTLGQVTDIVAPIVRKFCQQPGVFPPYNVLSH
jgi:hypothetical protein